MIFPDLDAEPWSREQANGQADRRHVLVDRPSHRHAQVDLSAFQLLLTKLCTTDSRYSYCWTKPDGLGLTGGILK